MRVVVVAAAERGASSALDAAVLDGAALAGALTKLGHDSELLTVPAPSGSMLSRVVATAESVALLSRLALMDPAPDAVVVVAPPHAPALCAEMVAALRRWPTAVLLTSLVTEARVRSGELNGESLITALRQGLEAALVRRARLLVVPTEPLRRRVLLRGAQPDRVRLVRNMFGPILPPPDPEHVQRLRARLAEGAPLLAVMPAALGAATDLGTLVGALTRLRDDHTFAFAAIASGSRAEMLRDMVQARGIRNAKVVTLTRTDRRAAVHAADVLLGVAVPAQDGLCVPRALARSVWAGKPLVAVGQEGSDLVRETRRLGLGPTVSPGDADGLATLLRDMARNPKSVAALGKNALRLARETPSPIPAILAQMGLEAPQPTNGARASFSPAG